MRVCVCVCAPLDWKCICTFVTAGVPLNGPLRAGSRGERLRPLAPQQQPHEDAFTPAARRSRWRKWRLKPTPGETRRTATAIYSDVLARWKRAREGTRTTITKLEEEESQRQKPRRLCRGSGHGGRGVFRKHAAPQTSSITLGHAEGGEAARAEAG